MKKRTMAKILVLLMVIQVWILWDFSQIYEWNPEKFTKNLCRIISLLGPREAQAGVSSVFGPQQYIRNTGKPNVYEETFSAPAGIAQIIIFNGEENGQKRVSSAIISLNGKQISGPRDFNENIYRLEKSIDLSQINTLRVELRSKPESYLSIEIIAGTINHLPIANSAQDQDVTVGSLVTLDGRGSFDPDGDPLTYQWQILSNPEGSTASLDDPSSATPTFSADKVGEYTISLTVNDGELESLPDNVVVRSAIQNLAIVPDETRQVVTLITPEGGTISTQGADGTKFTLTFPPAALLNPEEITLAPALSVTGLPLKGIVLASLHMGPPGLKFKTPASLTIEFPAPLSIQNRLVGFLFQDDGTNFSLIPTTLASNIATVQIDHFTGGGLMEVTDEEILNFAINEYYGAGGILDMMSAVNSCGGQSLDNAINKTVNFLKLVDFAPDIAICIYPGGGELCTTIFDLAEAARQSLENVIKNIFLLADNQCKSDPSKEVEAIECIASAQRVDGVVITQPFDATLVSMKTCGLSTIEIRPPAACLAVTESTRLEAIALDRSGNRLLGREMLWRSDNSMIASLSANDDTALVRGEGEGNTFINVYDKMSTDLGVIMYNFSWGQANIEVSKITVTIEPFQASIGIGGTVQLAATVTDSAGNPYTCCTVAWYSNSSSIADINPSGLVIGNGEGQATISAVCGEAIGVASIEVIKPRVTIEPAQATIGIGNTRLLTAAVTDSAGNPFTGCALAWYSNNTSVADVDLSGLVIGNGEGQATISAVCGGSTGLATVTVVGQKTWHKWSQSGNFNNMKLGADGDGNVFAAWQERSLPEVYIGNGYWPQTNYTGICLGQVGSGEITPVTTCEGTSNALLTDFFVDRMGNMIVGYTTPTSPAFQKWVKRYNVDLGWDNTPVLIGNTPISLRIAADSNGNAVVIWRDETYKIWALRYDVGQGWQSQPQIIQDPSGGTINEVNIAMDPQGNAMMVWSKYLPSEENYGIFTKRYIVNSGWESVFKRIASPTSLEFFDNVMDSNGKAIVIWYNPDVGIRARHYDFNNPDLLPPVINIADIPATMYEFPSPAISMDESGNALVTYWKIENGQESRFLMSKGYRIEQGWDNSSVTLKEVQHVAQPYQGYIIWGPGKTASIHGGGNATLVSIEDLWTGYVTPLLEFSMITEDTYLWAREFLSGEGWSAPVSDTVQLELRNFYYIGYSNEQNITVYEPGSYHQDRVQSRTTIIDSHGNATAVKLIERGHYEGHLGTNAVGDIIWLRDHWVWDNSEVIVMPFQ